MSGFWSGRCRALSSFRQQSFAPWMIQPWPHRAPGRENWCALSPLLLGPSRNDVIGESPALMGQLERPIQPLFYLHVGSSDGVVNLIELSLVGDREVVAQAAGRLEAADGRQLPAVWRRPMQIGGLRRLHPKRRL